MDLLLATIFAIGGVICHQRPERSFFVDGHQLPVCARCTGLYLSGAIGLTVWWAIKLARRWRPTAIDPRLAVRLLLMAAAPTAISLISGAIGWWDGSNLTRALVAIPLGVSAGAIAAAVSTKDLR
ncbi:MAG: DUF2085 domain-containing protein [Vicinamibacterales bacterium]